MSSTSTSTAMSAGVCSRSRSSGSSTSSLDTAFSDVTSTSTSSSPNSKNYAFYYSSPPSPLPPPPRPLKIHSRAHSASSDDTPSFVEIPPTRQSLRREHTIVPSSETTPRAPAQEPPMLRFERLLQQHKSPFEISKPPPPPPPPKFEEDEVMNTEPQPGDMIIFISSATPLSSPLSATFNILPQLLADDSDNLPAKPANTAPPSLRLTRRLGHGAFSDVWLAQDLSLVPLTLVSKKSVRDLRRRASGRENSVFQTTNARSRRSRSREHTGMDVDENGSTSAGKGAETDIETRTTEAEYKRAPSKLRDALKSIFSRSQSTQTSTSDVPSSPISDPPAAVPSESLEEIESLFKASASLSPSFQHEDHPHFGRSTHPSRTPSTVSFASFKGPSRQASLRIKDGTLSRDSSLKKLREKVGGTRPAAGTPLYDQSVDGGTLIEDTPGLSRRSSSVRSTTGRPHARLLAVKMTPRRARFLTRDERRDVETERAEEERTRVGFVREVEILKHISHPNITPLLANLSTPSHHILVLPYLPGGDLLGLVNNDVAYSKLGESVLRRIWSELCKAVGWMHGVGLVHRDIKLENILLTTPAFVSLTPSSPPPSLYSSSPSQSTPLPPPTQPLIKLTDFGLSRFIHIDQATNTAELLSTRCGSEAYAAPELVTGGSGTGYDARLTDAWACGVVLYAMCCRGLPFGEGGGPTGGKIGGERKEEEEMSMAERRQWLMKIALGEYEWPWQPPNEEQERSSTSERHHRHQKEDEPTELFGADLVRSEGGRRIVKRLLVRDVRRRGRVGDLWDDEWMWNPSADEIQAAGAWVSRSQAHSRAQSENGSTFGGGGGPEDVNGHSPIEFGFGDVVSGSSSVPASSRPHEEVHFEETGDDEMDEEDRDEDEEEEEEGGGWLLDQEGIDKITRQEVI